MGSRFASPRLSPALFGLVASCTGAIGDTNGTPGTGATTGVGTGTAGSGTGTAGTSPSGVRRRDRIRGSNRDRPGRAACPPRPAWSSTARQSFSRYVRLTHEQWENSVRDLLQLPALPGLSVTFTGDPPGGNFSNNERRLFMTSGLWSDYETAAETLSQQVARDATALSRVTGGTTVAATFIRNFGRRAYRRDLTAAEETTYGTLFSSGATIFASGNAFADGAADRHRDDAAVALLHLPDGVRRRQDSR